MSDNTHCFDLEYLKHLLEETNKKQEAFPFQIPDETGCDVSFIPSKLRIYWPGRIDTPYFRWEMEKAHISEKPKLSKVAKNYFRLVRKNGRLLRVDTYIGGRLDVIQIAHYDGDRRYCFPFSATGGFYPTYVDVVRFQDGHAVETYMVRSNQILYRDFRYTDPSRIELREINYVPTGTEPILSKSVGYFEETNKLRYVETYGWTFQDSPESK